MDTKLKIVLEKGSVKIKKRVVLTEEEKQNKGAAASGVGLSGVSGELLFCGEEGQKVGQQIAALERKAESYCFISIADQTIGKRNPLPLTIEGKTKNKLYLIQELEEKDLCYIEVEKRLMEQVEEGRAEVEKLRERLEREEAKVQERDGYVTSLSGLRRRAERGGLEFGAKVWDKKCSEENYEEAVLLLKGRVAEQNAELESVRAELEAACKKQEALEERVLRTRESLQSLPEDHPVLMEAAAHVKEEMGEERPWIAVYALSGELYLSWGARAEVYSNLISVRMRVQKLTLDPTELKIELHTVVENPYKLNVGNLYAKVGTLTSGAITPVQEKKHLTVSQLTDSKYLTSFTFSTPEIADHSRGDDSAVINGTSKMVLELEVEGCLLNRNLFKRFPKGSKRSTKEYYVPVASTYCGDWAINVRRNYRGVYMLVKRPLEPVEYRKWFRFMESKWVSGVLYRMGRFMKRRFKQRKIALFNEKYSEKSEEGVFELFKLCEQSKRTKSYFILDKSCPDFAELSRQSKNVVAKYSLKYYWLLFNANYYITTEAPMHLNLLYSNNRYLRRTFVTNPFIFLQHGVTYLKRHGDRSAYVKGKEAAVTYTLVNSEKEQKIVAEMFKISPKRIWNTGMLIFDRIEHQHLNQSSEDKITIMLTWKPYEESLTNFEDSTYFKYTMKTYELLQKYVDRSRINIVPHPRAYDLLMSTSIRDLVWQKPISEVLRESKLLITDYSSVCWNSFYQGGGVVFLQPDLQVYEDYVGKLIPGDEEYIGHRVFDFEALDEVFAKGLSSGSVDLSYFRTPAYENMFRSIVQHSDGKNTQRVYQTLVEKGFM